MINTAFTVGTGFLGHITVQRSGNTSDYYGLFTNNHVLKYENLKDDAEPIETELQFDNSDPNLVYKYVIGDLNKRFRFTCTLLDVTFVRFTQEEITKVQSSNNIKFLECSPLPMMGELEEPDGKPIATVAGHPDLSEFTDSPEYRATAVKRFSKGVLYKCLGFNILHHASTYYGSSGSPVLVAAKGQPQQYVVVGIHKGNVSESREQDPSNIATCMEAVVEAMKKLRINKTRKFQLIWKASDVSYEILLGKGLKKRSNTSHTRQTELFSYTSKLSTVETWFTFTSHGWYWTKENPYDSERDEFSHLTWMSINDLKGMDDEATKVAEWLKCENQYYAH